VNKLTIVTVIFVLLTIFCGGVFGAISIDTPSSGFDTNNTNFDFNLSPSNLDLNYFCFNLDSNCQNNSIAITSSPQTISYSNSELTFEQGSNIIYACEHDANVDTTNDWSCANITINYDSIAPTISTSSVSDGNYYSTSFSSITITIEDTTSPLDYVYASIDSNIDTNFDSVTGSGSLTLSHSSDLNDGVYIVTIDGNDSFGNVMATNTLTFTIDTTTPVIASITEVNWTSDTTPEIEITATDNGSTMTSGTAKIWCITESAAEEFSFSSSTVATFNITADADCNSTDGNKPIYIKVKDLAGNYSTTKESYVKFDNDPPYAPSNLEILEEGNGYIWIRWQAPTTSDAHSGNTGYTIYKGDQSYSTTYETDGSWLKKQFTGLSNGIAYSFGVKTKDAAGNYSDKSTVIGTPQEDSCGCDVTVKKSGTIIEYAKPSDTLTVSCDIEEVSDNARIRYNYDSDITQNLTNEEDNTENVTSTFNVDSGYDQVKFWCTWEYNSTSFESSTRTIILDNEPPILTWNDTNDTFSGKRTISFDTTDNKFNDTVTLSIGTNNLATTKSVDTYSHDFNSQEYENGTHSLKATVVDKAGNKTEKIRTITIQNVVTKETAKNTLINNAMTKKKIVEDLIDYLEEQGVLISQKIIDDKAIADQLVNDANLLTEVNDINAKIFEAIEIYNKINSELPTGVEVISTRNYDYLTQDIMDALVELGINQTTAEKVLTLIEATGSRRTIEIVKVDQNYQAKIKISFTNDTNDTKIKIIEIIPKEFAASASLIHSSHPFVIIEDDPIIEFAIDAPIGSEVEISYGIANLSEEDANILIDSNVIANFATPPLVTGEDLDIATSIGEGDGGLGFMLMIIVIIIVLIVIAGAGIFIYIQYSKNNTPSFNSAKKEGISNKLKNKVKKNNDKDLGKWKYKG
jgi:hypothetical protein